jgi:2,3-bisphosphoglycerate-dependent phosphoglycerate mutase
MRFLFLLLFTVPFCSCKTTTYYISRHAEKAGAMSTDPPLTDEGEKQAQDLKNYLSDKKIGAVFSTNTIRTKATAKPTAEHYNLLVNIYEVVRSATLMDSLKAHNRRNVLVVGHSNTVDDMVNRLTGTNTMTDLPDSEYGSLFVVRKKGNGYSVEKITVPQTAPR